MFKSMLVGLSIWMLRKFKVSVVMGIKFSSGEIRFLNSHSRVYDNTGMGNVRVFDCDGFELPIPTGKFYFTHEAAGETHD